jgi:transposase
MIHGARAVVGWRKHRPVARDPRLGGLLARRHVNVATVAFANKSARIAWALTARGRIYTTARARAA